MEITVNNLQETQILASQIAGLLPSKQKDKQTALVLFLFGDLGSGKTTFVQSLAENLGVTETVISPTFVILKKYKLPTGGLFDQLIHIDGYRLEPQSNLDLFQLVDLINNPRNLLVIEWPDIFSKSVTELTDNIWVLNFTFLTETKRLIKYD